MARGNAIEWSHGRARPVVRVDEAPALPSDDSPPMHDGKTGRFIPGNRAYRRRQLVRRAEGIATLDPHRVPSWLKPHVKQGAGYVKALLALLEGKPALYPLAGDLGDAHVLYRATLALALGEDDPKTRAALMGEARGWLREHRAALATLSALAGGMKLPEPDHHQALVEALAGDDRTRTP